jgi:hypothetical protein
MRDTEAFPGGNAEAVEEFVRGERPVEPLGVSEARGQLLAVAERNGANLLRQAHFFAFHRPRTNTNNSP